MKKNMGNLDRIGRVIAAIVIITLYAMEIITGTLGITLIVLSVIFVLTSIVSFCPLYLPFGMNTCEVEEQK